eukprot:3783233-Rhodomonas_salina.1
MMASADDGLAHAKLMMASASARAAAVACGPASTVTLPPSSSPLDLVQACVPALRLPLSGDLGSGHIRA